jgi:hypothetical protein
LSRKRTLNAEQQRALKHLASLTETGREGLDWSNQCGYKPGGTDNGVMLHQMGVTDADMRCFSLLPEWRYITLRECPVTDAGLKHLAGQSELLMLEIGETSVTTLHPIRGATKLQQLWCDRLERLTDRKAVALANFTDLRFLDLCYAAIGDVTAKRLAGLHELRGLNLLRTKVTDEGLRHIGTLPKLEKLGLVGTAITDDGLSHLHGMSYLRMLFVRETQVTKKGIASIRRAIPGVEVTTKGGIW